MGLDIELTRQGIEQLRPVPAEECQPVLVPDCSLNKELLGEGLHPLQLHLHFPLWALSHPLQVIESNSAVKTLK